MGVSAPRKPRPDPPQEETSDGVAWAWSGLKTPHLAGGPGRTRREGPRGQGLQIGQSLRRENEISGNRERGQGLQN